MIIYTVRPGDTPYSLSRKFLIASDKIIRDNRLEDVKRLVTGQALIIDSDTLRHRVTAGQSLDLLARRYGAAADDILALNPGIRICPGQNIIIPQGNSISRSIDVNGFSLTPGAFVGASAHLTYISELLWSLGPGGALSAMAGQETAQGEADDCPAPLMCVTNLLPGSGFSGSTAHEALTGGTDVLMEDILNKLISCGYRGVCLDFEYIYPSDRESYSQFLIKLSGALRRRGFILAVVLSPEMLRRTPELRVHGQVSDLVMLMTYGWGHPYGPPGPASPIAAVRKTLERAVTVIPSGKILMGMPGCGYDWTLPFSEGSAARAISAAEAIKLAASGGAGIMYEHRRQAPHFNYYDNRGKKHEVWFDDARSYRARLELIDEYGLAGVSLWYDKSLFMTGTLVLRSMFGVNKMRR